MAEPTPKIQPDQNVPTRENYEERRQELVDLLTPEELDVLDKQYETYGKEVQAAKAAKADIAKIKSGEVGSRANVKLTSGEAGKCDDLDIRVDKVFDRTNIFALTGTSREVRLGLHNLFEKLVNFKLTKEEARIYKKQTQKGAESLTPEERAFLNEIEWFTEEEYEQMKDGRIPWKLNAVWRAIDEYNRGVLAPDEPAKPADQNAAVKTGLVAAAGLGLGALSGSALAGANPFKGKDMPPDLDKTIVDEEQIIASLYQEMDRLSSAEAEINRQLLDLEDDLAILNNIKNIADPDERFAALRREGATLLSEYFAFGASDLTNAVKKGKFEQMLEDMDDDDERRFLKEQLEATCANLDDRIKKLRSELASIPGQLAITRKELNEYDKFTELQLEQQLEEIRTNIAALDAKFDAIADKDSPEAREILVEKAVLITDQSQVRKALGEIAVAKTAAKPVAKKTMSPEAKAAAKLAREEKKKAAEAAKQKEARKEANKAIVKQLNARHQVIVDKIDAIVTSGGDLEAVADNLRETIAAARQDLTADEMRQFIIGPMVPAELLANAGFSDDQLKEKVKLLIADMENELERATPPAKTAAEPLPAEPILPTTPKPAKPEPKAKRKPKPVPAPAATPPLPTPAAAPAPTPPPATPFPTIAGGGLGTDATVALDLGGKAPKPPEAISIEKRIEASPNKELLNEISPIIEADNAQNGRQIVIESSDYTKPSTFILDKCQLKKDRLLKDGAAKVLKELGVPNEKIAKLSPTDLEIIVDILVGNLDAQIATIRHLNALKPPGAHEKFSTPASEKSPDAERARVMGNIMSQLDLLQNEHMESIPMKTRKGEKIDVKKYTGLMAQLRSSGDDFISGVVINLSAELVALGMEPSLAPPPFTETEMKLLRPEEYKVIRSKMVTNMSKLVGRIMEAQA